MSPLVAHVFALVVSLAAAPAVDLSDPVEVARLQQTAEDVAAVASEKDGYPFSGPARVEALAVALVVLAKYESDFSRRVDTCRLTGDRMTWHRPWEGYSISLWQLRAGRAWAGHTRRQICTDRRLAASLAVDVLALYKNSGSVGGLFRGYASGNSGVDSKAARVRCASWEKHARAAGITAASCWKSAAVSFAPRE
jgi:hypothetical protein